MSPFPFSTNNASRRAKTAPMSGYQPTGIQPSTRLAPAVFTSTMATVLLSALATSIIVPSGDSARLFGVVPTGALGYSATEICSFAVFDCWSMTHTAFVFAHATKSRPPSFDRSIALGCGPTAISPSDSSVSAANIRTLPPPQSDTNSVRPSAETTAVYGSAA